MPEHPQPQRFPPDDPREWLRRAREDLTIAQASIAGVGYEPRAFHAHQAAEKAIKAVCIARGVVFPFTHALDQLLAVLAANGVDISAVQGAARLNRFATDGRYPAREPVAGNELEEALSVASSILEWASPLASVRHRRVREIGRPGYHAAPSPGADAPDPALLQQLVERVVEAVSPERIILFGSAARGTMSPHSDLDLLVVVAHRDRGDHLHEAVYDAVRPLAVTVDVVIATTRDLERYGRSIGLVYRPALEDGRELYRRVREGGTSSSMAAE